MNLAGAEKLARRLHRGEIDDAGQPYVDHLSRVAALVRSYGGDECEQMAAWLHRHDPAGANTPEATAPRLPRRVARIVRALTSTTHWESADDQANRIRSCPGASLVLRADAADLCEPGAAPPAARWWSRQRSCDRYRDLLASLGEPGPLAPSPAPGTRRLDAGMLLSQLTSGGPDRWTAARTLGSIGELHAARPLIAAYLAAEAGDPLWVSGKAQLAAAISAIAAQRRHQDDEQWVQTLAGLASHPNPFLRATAIRGLAGLARYQPLTIKALADDSPQVAAAALSVLNASHVRQHRETVTELVRRAGPSWARTRRLAAHHLVAASCVPGCDDLLRLLASDGMGLGRDVVTAVVKQCGQPAIPQLIAQVLDRAPGRAAAAFALGELKASEAVPGLAAALSEERTDIQFAVACIDALAKIAEPSAVPALATATRHRISYVRASALTALSSFDHTDVTEVALAASEDFEPDVREKAVRLLAARGDRRATARLLSYCDGPLAAAALRGLIRIADERAVPALRQLFLNTTSKQIRHLAGRALARSSPSAALYPGWSMPPAQLRAIAWVLGEIADRNSSRHLSPLLNHPDELVRARTAAALGKIADPATAAALRDRLGDIAPRGRAASATAIGRLANNDAARWLREALQDPHPAVRSAARAALRRLAAGES
jgi:HEAT repeat protein